MEDKTGAKSLAPPSAAFGISREAGPAAAYEVCGVGGLGYKRRMVLLVYEANEAHDKDCLASRVLLDVQVLKTCFWQSSQE